MLLQLAAHTIYPIPNLHQTQTLYHLIALSEFLLPFGRDKFHLIYRNLQTPLYEPSLNLWPCPSDADATPLSKFLCLKCVIFSALFEAFIFKESDTVQHYLPFPIAKLSFGFHPVEYIIN